MSQPTTVEASPSGLAPAQSAPIETINSQAEEQKPAATTKEHNDVEPFTITSEHLTKIAKLGDHEHTHHKHAHHGHGHSHPVQEGSQGSQAHSHNTHNTHHHHKHHHSHSPTSEKEEHPVDAPKKEDHLAEPHATGGDQHKHSKHSKHHHTHHAAPEHAGETPVGKEHTVVILAKTTTLVGEDEKKAEAETHTESVVVASVEAEKPKAEEVVKDSKEGKKLEPEAVVVAEQ